MRVDVAEKLSGLSIIELYIQRIFVVFAPAEYIFARLEREIAYSDWHLRDKKVRIFSFRRIAGSDEYHAGDESAASVCYRRCGSKFCLDALLLNGSSRGNYVSQ